MNKTVQKFLDKTGMTLEEYNNPPLCKTCQVKKVLWNHTNNKWKTYCSNECKYKDPEFHVYRSKKIHESFLNKYNMTEEQFNNPPRCKICNNQPVEWDHRNKKWKSYCSRSCVGNDHELKKETIKNRNKTNILKYGGNWMSTDEGNQHLKEMWKNRTNEQKDIIKNKSKETLLLHYGVDNAMKDPDVLTQQINSNKKTLLYRYGVEHNMYIPEISKKSQIHREETLLSKYGEKTAFNVPELMKNSQKKIRQTLLNKYGVTHPMHIPGVVKKMNENIYKAKKYTLPSGKIVYLRGYEPNFLDYVFKNNIFLENEIDYSPLTIKYVYNNINRLYYPDFFIPTLNLIIEPKSDYILEKQGILKQEAKQKACQDLNYHYLLIINNDFTVLQNIKEIYGIPKR